MCNLRFPKKRPMSAPKITVAMIAAPCAPSVCHRVETGHAMRQPALIARPAPAPYRAPATVGRVASEFRNTQLNNRTRIPPASVLPIPQREAHDPWRDTQHFVDPRRHTQERFARRTCREG